MARKTKAEAERTRQQIIDTARQVFHAHGVIRSSLEKVAQAAGVTRGAVYWHFANKAELFTAMREHSHTLIEPADRLVLSEDFADPLDAVEQSMLAFFRVLEESEELRQIFEIMSLRCEYVDEFAPVLHEVNGSCLEFLGKLEIAYARAREKGTLREGMSPEALALDTISFTSGVFNNWLSSQPGDRLRTEVPAMIRTHIALRRR